MPNKKEIKTHINSVSDIYTLTNAMYLIASTKLKKAKDEFNKTRPYFSSLEKAMKDITSDVRIQKNRYYLPHEGGTAVVVITGDKGLCGAYNHVVIKEVKRLTQEKKEYTLFPVGLYGQRYYKNSPEKRNVIPDFHYTNLGTRLITAREVTERLLKSYNDKKFSEIYIVYNDYQGGTEETVVTKKILPLELNQEKVDYDFFPTVDSVLEKIVPNYIVGYLYSALVDAYCSEQNARMTAMDSANRNAEKIIDELSAEYDTVRQNAITQELIEISAGAQSHARQNI